MKFQMKAERPRRRRHSKLSLGGWFLILALIASGKALLRVSRLPMNSKRSEFNMACRQLPRRS